MCWFVLQNLDGELRLSSCDITVYRCREQVCLTLARWVIFSAKSCSSKSAKCIWKSCCSRRNRRRRERHREMRKGPQERCWALCCYNLWTDTLGPKGHFSINNQYTDKRNIVFTAPKYLKFPGKSPCGWNLLSLLDDGGSAHCDLQCRRKFSVVFPRSVPRYSRVGRLHFCLCSNMHW